VKKQFLTLFALLAILFGGCLTAEQKELRLSLNADGKSGTGTIIFTGIASEQGDDTMDVSKEDLNSLITEYYQGKTLENAMPGTSNVKKRLFTSGGQLVGELSFDFADISKLGFFRYKNQGPYQYYTLADGYFTSGQFAASNGTFGGEKMPIVFWDEVTKDFYVKMSLSSPGAPRTSLLEKYKEWEKKKN
jgi:hypothetical protein